MKVRNGAADFQSFRGERLQQGFAVYETHLKKILHVFRVEDINTHAQVLVVLKWLMLSATNTMTLFDQLQDIIHPKTSLQHSEYQLLVYDGLK